MLLCNLSLQVQSDPSTMFYIIYDSCFSQFRNFLFLICFRCVIKIKHSLVIDELGITFLHTDSRRENAGDTCGFYFPVPVNYLVQILLFSAFFSKTVPVCVFLINKKES